MISNSVKHQTRPWNIFNCRSPAGCVRDGAADGVLGDATGAPPQRPRLGGGCHNTRSDRVFGLYEFTK